MINTASIEEIRKNAPWREEFLRPYATHYSFERIPQSLKALLGNVAAEDLALPAPAVGGRYTRKRKVAAFFIDALGWTLIEKLLGKSALLNYLETNGTLSQLTTQFPSSTPVMVTTMSTGQPMHQHGIPELDYYEPTTGHVLNPLFYRFTDTKEQPLEMQAGGFYPPSGGAFWRELAENGAAPKLFLPQHIAYSTFNKFMNKGATQIGFDSDNLDDGLEKMRVAFNSAQEGSLLYFYTPILDQTCHYQGPESTLAFAAAENILDRIWKKFVCNELRDTQETSIVLFADHGQMTEDRTDHISLSGQNGLGRYLRRTRDFAPIVMTGGPRSPFLYAKDECADELCEKLSAQLGERALVAKTSELLGSGIFGTNPSDRLLERLPNIILLPRGNRTAWWWSDYRNGTCGQHGGLTPSEMLIPFGHANL